MKINQVHDYAIQAHMAAIVGAEEYDRLFPGVQFSDVEGDIMYAYCPEAELAEEMEEKYSLHLSIIASEILKREVGIVMVLPRALAH